MDAGGPLEDVGLVLGEEDAPVRLGRVLEVYDDEAVVLRVLVRLEDKLGAGVGDVVEVVLHLEDDLREVELAGDLLALQLGVEDEVVPAVLLRADQEVLATVTDGRTTRI